MIAIFNKYCQQVGWINQNDNMLYSLSMQWIGFIKEQYVFTPNCVWVGGFFCWTVVDKLGKPVAWANGHQPTGTLPLIKPIIPIKPLKPIRPLKPIPPLRPLRPLVPLGGWSRLEWEDLWK